MDLAAEHAMQAPAQALLQQKPSTQKPDAQSPDTRQAPPMAVKAKSSAFPIEMSSLYPAATRVLPFPSRMAVCESRALTMLPAEAQVPSAGSYSSELAVETKFEKS